MKRKIGKWILSVVALFAILVSSIGSFVQHASAAENNSLPYNVLPVFPKNQDKNVSQYISITSNNGVNQQITFKLANNSKVKQQVIMKILNAYTSPNAIIQYETNKSEDAKIIDKRYQMKRYAKLADKVTLEPGQVKVVKVDLQVPKIKGTVLGGVAFQISNDQQQESNNKEVTFNLKNKINTIYGIAVHSSKEQKAKFSFGNVYVDPMASYYAVRLPITLHSPLIVQNAAIDYQVSYKGEKLFFAKKVMKFAPMTKTNFSIPFDYKEIKPGETYTLKGRLTYTDENGQKHVQKFKKDFQYKKDATKTIAKILKTPFDNGHSWFIYLLLFILLLLILFFIYMRRKKAKEAEKAVALAEETLLKKDVDIAQFLVNKLAKRSKHREILQIRLNAIQETLQITKVENE